MYGWAPSRAVWTSFDDEACWPRPLPRRELGGGGAEPAAGGGAGREDGGGRTGPCPSRVGWLGFAGGGTRGGGELGGGGGSCFGCSSAKRIVTSAATSNCGTLPGSGSGRALELGWSSESLCTRAAAASSRSVERPRPSVTVLLSSCCPGERRPPGVRESVGGR